MKLAKLMKRTRIDKPKKFRLAEWDPSDAHGVDVSKDAAQARLDADVARLTDLQQRLYAQDRWAVLIILQGMDAAGKDGVVKHVMAGVNPQGCDVHSFKAPSAEELDHDYLWRSAQRLPERGRIGIFNRSYYEEVLIARVHPDVLAQQKLPRELVTRHIWHQRFEDICAFERTLAHNGTLVLKFFLHISKEEQLKRFKARLDDSSKQWKISDADYAERGSWDEYLKAYEDALSKCSTADAPWFVIPSDHKWFRNLAVARIVVERLEALRMSYPKPSVDMGKVRKEFKAAKRGA